MILNAAVGTAGDEMAEHQGLGPGVPFIREVIGAHGVAVVSPEYPGVIVGARHGPTLAMTAE